MNYFVKGCIVFFTAIMLLPTCVVSAADATRPTCVLMKFTNDTRYQEVDAADVLSDLVMEKMIASGNFNIKETRPIDKNMERMLYDEKMREATNANQAMRNGDYGVLFEGAGFNERKAQSISTATEGQIVTPSITSAIGKAHGAGYLIQGTIINMGNGGWIDPDLEGIATAFRFLGEGASQLARSGALRSNGGTGLGAAGLAMSLIGSMKQENFAIGVQCDLRIINAQTGEVVWVKRVTGVNVITKTSMARISVGSTKSNNELYAKALDNAAQDIVDAMTTDLRVRMLL